MTTIATDVERLIVTLEARTKEYERALAKAQGTTVSALRKVERSMQVSATRQQTIFAKMGAGINATLQRSLFGPLAALAGTAGLARLSSSVRSAIGEVAELSETADKVGLLVTELQELRFAADQTGVSQGNLDMAMQRFSRRVGEAVQGSGELLGTLRQYNIQLTDSAGKTRPLVDILKDYADVIQNAGSQQERLRIAFKGFDSEGAALVNTLKDGAAGLNGYFAAARNAGIVTDETAQKARRLDERFKEASHTLNVAWQNAVIGAVDGLGDLGPLVEFVASEMKLFAENAKITKDQIVAIVEVIDNLSDGLGKVATVGTIDVPVAELEQQLHTLAEVIARHQARLEAATTDHQRHLIKLDIQAAEAEFARLEHRLNSLIGPAFEQLGRQSAAAFEQGFKPKVSLPTVTHGTGGGLTGSNASTQGIIDSITRSIAMQKESDPVARRMLALQEQLVGATREEVAHIQRLIAQEERLLQSSERTADGVREIPPGFDRLGDHFSSAIGQQTSALTSAFDRGFGAIAGATGGGPGAFGGSAGGTQSMKFSVNVAAKKQLEALARERDVIQSGLQFKQLSGAEETAAQRRLAEIDMETAKLNQHMGEVAAAFQDLKPSLLSMVASGMEFDQIVQSINSSLKHRFGASGANFFSSNTIPGFAGGGQIHGAGGPRSDSVPIMASAGEFVVNAASTKKHRALLDAINGGRLAGMADGGVIGKLNGAVQRLANGGMVQSAPAASSRGDVNINLGGVSVMAQDGRVSRESTREAGRQVAQEAAYYLREQGVI